jgi:hypothetical protein
MPKEVYEDPEVTGRNRYKYFDRYKVMTDEHVSPDFVRKSLYNQNGSYLLCVCVVLGFELRVRAYTLSHTTSPFLRWVFFEIGSCELFAQAGFEI